MSGDPLLEAHGLEVRFPVRRGFLARAQEHLVAVRGVDLALERGRTLGLVGESGSGKTTLARALLRLVEPSAGSLSYRSDPEAEPVDLRALSQRALRPLRRELQIVFQDPVGSLNPRMTVGDIVGEGPRAHGLARGSALRRRTAELLERVGLPRGAARRFPHELSGGERQRVGLARALALEPRLLVCDEPTSALDVSVQAQVLELLAGLRRDLGLTLLFVSHDLGVVRLLADRVAVLYLGRIVEEGAVQDVFEAPGHPYTRALLASRPLPDPCAANRRGRDRIVLSGDVPSALRPPGGCPFRARCPDATEICTTSYPQPVWLRAAPSGDAGNGAPEHWAACHHVEEPAPGDVSTQPESDRSRIR